MLTLSNFYSNFYTDIKWKLFYIFFSFLVTFVVCVDSWEYILNYEISFLIKSNLNISSQGFVFTKIAEGQTLIYLVSIFYSFVSTLLITILLISLFLIPALYKEEAVNLFINFLFFIILFIIIFFLNHYIIFPIVCQDLLQYKYSNPNDFALSLRIEPLLSILDFIKMKFKILSLIYCINVYWYFLLWFNQYNLKFIHIMIYYRFIIMFLVTLIVVFFFETEIYITTYMIFLNWFTFECLLFIVLLQQKYQGKTPKFVERNN